jgi:hypothetical protein
VSDEQDESEIVCDSYRRRERLMGWILFPFDFIDLIALAGGAIALIAWACKVWF